MSSGQNGRISFLILMSTIQSIITNYMHYAAYKPIYLLLALTLIVSVALRRNLKPFKIYLHVITNQSIISQKCAYK